MDASSSGLSRGLEEIKTKFGGSFFKASNFSVGVDVGSSSIKVVELERKDDALILKNFAVAHGEQELIKPGTSGVISEAAGSIIKKTLSESGIGAKKVNVAVPSFSSLITTIEIPNISKDEIDVVIQKEAPKYIPVQLSEVVYGWQIIEELPLSEEDKKNKKSNELAGGETKQHVLIVAIMKEISDQYDKVFSLGDLSIDSLEIDSFSLTRSLIGNDPGAYLVLDIGHKVCNIIAISNKNILLNRTIDVAGDRITKVISQSMNIDMERAEKLKIEQGISASKDRAAIVDQALSVLIGEIRKTIKVLGENYPEVDNLGIILSGGGSKLKGFKEYVEQEAGLKTIIGNPFSTIAYPEQIKDAIQMQSPTLAIAAGLAMLGFEDK